MRRVDQNPAAGRHRPRPLLSSPVVPRAPVLLSICRRRARLVRRAAPRRAPLLPASAAPAGAPSAMRAAPASPGAAARPEAPLRRRRRPRRALAGLDLRSWPRAGRAGAAVICRARSRWGAPRAGRWCCSSASRRRGATTRRCRARSSCSTRSRVRRLPWAPSTFEMARIVEPWQPGVVSWGRSPRLDVPVQAGAGAGEALGAAPGRRHAARADSGRGATRTITGSRCSRRATTRSAPSSRRAWPRAPARGWRST